MRWTAAAVILLMAIAVAAGVTVNAQERAFRHASARAADDFDLLIGAPGGQAQLVLTSVYLRPEALPLMDGGVLKVLGGDPRVAAAAPLAFGDIVQGYPVIGTTAVFVTRFGRLTPADGRVFARQDEAVIGADVRLGMGDRVTPSHGVQGAESKPGEEGPSERAHRHHGVAYTVVGRLPRLSSPWDRAILVPVESVWETHGLGDGHAAPGAAIGPPFDAAKVPPVPAIVVKPRAVADAYALRAAYRQGVTMALFPAEVLVSVYQTLGDARDILLIVSVVNTILVALTVVLLLITLTGSRRRRYALLRALGAPRHYVLTVVWLNGAIPLVAGVVLGLGLGWVGANAAGQWLAGNTGLRMAATLGWDDVGLVAGLALLGSVLAVVPALFAWRVPPAEGLRD